MRWPIEAILDMLMAGMTAEDIVSEHPELEQEDIPVALAFTKSRLMNNAIRLTA